MSDYAHAVDVNAPADELFEFLSDVSNLPQYLPATEHVEVRAEDGMQARGRVSGQREDRHGFYRQGFYRVDRQARRMEWGGDGERTYRGKLEIKDNGPRHATVRVCLTFDRAAADAHRDHAQDIGERRVTVQQALERALRAIKALVEAGASGLDAARLEGHGFDGSGLDRVGLDRARLVGTGLDGVVPVGTGLDEIGADAYPVRAPAPPWRDVRL